jgi:hypothetical protein
MTFITFPSLLLALCLVGQEALCVDNVSSADPLSFGPSFYWYELLIHRHLRRRSDARLRLTHLIGTASTDPGAHSLSSLARLHKL